jgi:uncharacterized protein (TIGR02145 family)
MKKLSIYLAAVLCIASAVSCKDDETTDSYSISGLGIEGVAAFVAAGDTQHVKIDVSNLKTTADALPEKIGLYYQVNTAKRDTITKDIKANPVTSFNYRADTLGYYTITCYAYDTAGKQYSSSASASFRAINPKTALSGLSGDVTPGNKYIEKAIGGKTWMAQNLYETTSGLPYEGCVVLDPLFGRFYTYEEALTACPTGWHLPSQAEWDALGTESGALMADAVFLSDNLWPLSKTVTITNSLGFNAIPTGYIDRTYIININSGAKEYAMFWTADAKDASLAHYRYIFGTNPVVQKGEGSRTSLALSVRCVK